MKLLKIALFALTLLLLTPAALAGARRHQPAPGASTVVMAMEPASWIFVAFGLLGGGFLRRRRLPGLNLVTTLETLAAKPKATTTNPRPTASNLATQTRFSLSLAMVLPGKVWAGAAAAVLLLLAANPASADTITFDSQVVSPIALAPSGDTFSLNSDAGTVDTTAGAFVLQTGDFIIGDSEIPDQVIPFSFQDTLTLNGITQTLTLYGQDSVTQTADTLTIFASTPVTFGNEILSVQNFTLSESAMGDFPVELQANVTPEPSSLLLLGTGVAVGALLLRKRDALNKA